MARGVLGARHLTRRFGARVAVEDVSFELVPGEVFALLGPNGAGKTTTLRLLAGLLRPSSGQVCLDEEPVTSTPAFRRRVGFLTETPGLWDRLTVRQNLLVYARLYALASPEVAVERALDRLDIRSRATEQAARLSKGLKQRVALARSLLHDPAIVLLDEPTAGLDPESARGVRDLVLRLRDSGCSVLLSTHNLDEVQRVADRVAVMRARLVALDTPAALRARLFGSRVHVQLAGARPVDLEARLHEAGFADLRADGLALSVGLDHERSTPALVRTLVELGAAVESVVPEQPSLEEVYLRLMQEGRT